MGKIDPRSRDLSDASLATMAAIAGAKKIVVRDICEAGIETNPEILKTLEDLGLVEIEVQADKVEDTVYKPTKNGCSVLYHKQWDYSGVPIFVHHQIPMWILFLFEAFGEAENWRIKMDLGLEDKDIEPYLAKMAAHNMIVRDGDTAHPIDKSKWKLDPS